MVKYSGVNHLALVTGDMDRTVRFWRDLLGLPLVAGMGQPGYRHYFFALGPHDLIAFFEWPQVEPLPEKDHGYPVTGRVVFDHISMGVEAEDDLWELKDRLEAAGFWVSEIMDHGFIHSLYSFDPNGIPIEFSHYQEGVDLRARPVMIDREPSPATREGSAPRPGHWPPVEDPTPAAERAVYPGEGASLVDPQVKQTW